MDGNRFLKRVPDGKPGREDRVNNEMAGEWGKGPKRVESGEVEEESSGQTGTGRRTEQ